VTAKDERTRFGQESADELASAVGADPSTRPSGRRSARFCWYQDASTLTLVVGEQEGKEVDRALAVGLAEREDRDLVLVLPQGWHEPTLHRWAWLDEALPISVWTHKNGTVEESRRPTRQETMETVKGGEDPHLHLGERTAWVEDLMRWAGDHPDLDPSHRRQDRAWQCRGQRVLLIKRTKNGLRIVAGIDFGPTSGKPPALKLTISGPLQPEDLQAIQARVRQGCDERKSGIAHKADEHWLQSVLRRHPEELGLEQPVLRELPAWRPNGSEGTRQAKPRGRGFVDLAGLDACGNLLLVETKLGADDLLVLQGLDYLIWAEANRDRLTSRLDAQRTIPFEISYCVGGKKGTDPSWSRHAKAQLQALAPDVLWHVQEVTNWTDDGASAERLPLRQLPA
jgi:hypothetical protein